MFNFSYFGRNRDDKRYWQSVEIRQQESIEECRLKVSQLEMQLQSLKDDILSARASAVTEMNAVCEQLKLAKEQESEANIKLEATEEHFNRTLESEKAAIARFAELENKLSETNQEKKAAEDKILQLEISSMNTEHLAKVKVAELESALENLERQKTEAYLRVINLELQVTTLETSEKSALCSLASKEEEMKLASQLLESAVSGRKICEQQLGQLAHELEITRRDGENKIRQMECEAKQKQSELEAKFKATLAALQMKISSLEANDKASGLAGAKLAELESQLKHSSDNYRQLMETFPDIAKFQQDRKDLLKAASQGSVAKIEKILKENPHYWRTLLEAREDFPPHNTPLMLAAAKGYSSSVNILLDYGARVDAMNDNGDNAFLLAVDSGRVEAISLLIGLKGAFAASQEFNKENRDGNVKTALLRACERGQTKAVAFLLSKYASSFYRVSMEEGTLAAKITQRHGFNEIAQLLASRGFKL